MPQTPLRAAQALEQGVRPICVHPTRSIGRGVDPEQAVDKVLDLFLGSAPTDDQWTPYLFSAALGGFAKPDMATGKRQP